MSADRLVEMADDAIRELRMCMVALQFAAERQEEPIVSLEKVYHGKLCVTPPKAAKKKKPAKRGHGPAQPKTVRVKMFGRWVNVAVLEKGKDREVLARIEGR